LVQREWWQRIWTVQETTTTAEKVVLCGSCVIPFEAFFIAREVYEWLRRAGKVTIADEADRGFDLVRDRNQAAGKVSAGSDVELPEFLTLLRRNMATDPRDKVYATLGFREDFATNIPIDYALPIATVISIRRSIF
jgi:hypothetical protein